jgi:LytS/YehU family sensor histidine kinase
MIYESREEFIPVTQEIELLQNYIDLEKLRYGQELELSISISGDIEGKWIRPLLLLPLIENSFKHGMSQQLMNKWISMELHIERNTLFFKLGNSKDSLVGCNNVHGKSNGIGLENVKRRLNLLYPGKNKFQVTESDDLFLVDIELKLTETREMGDYQKVTI